MTTDELIRALRAWVAAYKVAGGHDSLVRDLDDAADRLESIQAENAFLKAMQRQMADGVHDIGAMVEHALKKEATANDNG